MRPSQLFVSFGGLCLVLVSASAHGQSNRPTPGRMMAKPPQIDGVIQDEEWAGIPAETGFSSTWTKGLAVEQTEVRIAYDKSNIYIAFRCQDSQPSAIVARSMQNGVDLSADDQVAFTIDALNRRSGGTRSAFLVNAAGTINDEIAGGRSAKVEWRGQWKGAAKINSDGWSAEMAIPWAMIEVPNAAKADMQINFIRYNPRLKERSTWSDTTERNLVEFDGLWQGVEPPRIKQRPQVSTMIYVAPEYDEDSDPRFTFRSGIDFRIRPNSRTTGVLSFNPDFRNIEQQLADFTFSRSERFEGDARTFFKEGEGFFQLSSQVGLMFYSRRITDFDQAAKFFGSVSNSESVGVLASREDGRRTDVVAKYTKRLAPRTSISAFTTSSSGGVDSNVVGSGATIGKGNWDFGVNAVLTENRSRQARAYSGTLAYSVPKLSIRATYKAVEPGFGSALALIGFNNQKGGVLGADYNSSYTTGGIQRFNAGVYMEAYDTFKGEKFTRTFSPYFGLTTRSDIQFNFSANATHFFNEPEAIYSAVAVFNASNSQRQYGISTNIGHRNGEGTSYLSLFGSYRFAKGLDASLDHSVFSFMRQTTRTVAGLGWEIDRNQAIGGRFVQLEDDSTWYLSYRNSGGRGLETFVILGDPNSSTFRNRFSVKLVWAR